MKKVLLISLFLLIPLIATADLGLNQIGDKVDVKITINSGDISYKELREKSLDGYEPVYYYENVTTQKTGGDLDNNSKNVTFLYNESILVTKINSSVNGTPIYSYSEVQGIEYNSTTYSFDNMGCWVCGNYMACLSKKDGFSYNRGDAFKCNGSNYPILRDGESGWIKNLLTDEIVFDRSDVGVVQ